MSADLVKLCATLQERLGAAQVGAGAEDAAAFQVDGRVPALVVRPGTQEEVAAVVAACHAAGASLLAWGGGTAMGLGNRPTCLDVVILLERLNRVVEYDPANLCVTVEAGMRLADLQALLVQDQEMLPIDPAADDRVTLGGLVAANQSGPGRLLYGTVRDWLLGLRVVLADGERVHFGGRVIKNVSGYDMNKMLIASLGTLGIITEVTVKLLPVPAQRAGLLGRFPGLAPAMAAVRDAQASFLLPEAMELLDPAAMALLAGELGRGAGPAEFGLAVAVAGSPETVARQVAEFTARFEAAGGRVGPLADAAWSAIRNLFDRLAGGGPAPLLCRITVPIAQVASMVEAARELGRSGLRATVTAHAGSGVVWAAFTPGVDGVDGGDGVDGVDGVDGPDASDVPDVPAVPDVAVLAALLAGLRSQAEAVAGSLVLQAAPPAVKQALDAWGEPGLAIGVMRQLKQKFDPRGTCSPGRFLGGI